MSSGRSDRSSQHRTKLFLIASVSCIALAGCDRPATTAPLRPRPQESFIQASKSPLERTTFDAEVTISISGGDSPDGKTHHKEFAPVVVQGRVVKGTGYVDLKSLEGMPVGMPTHLPVLETDFGHRHGAATNRHGRGLDKAGHLLALDNDASADQGPSQAMRFSLDGETIVSSTQNWSRNGDAWELHDIVANQFLNGQVARRTVVKIKVRRNSAHASLLAPASAASLSLAVADRLSSFGGAALEVLSPTLAWAQETQTNWNDGIVKFLSAVGGVILAAGAIIEGAIFGIIGGIIVMVATLWDFDVWAAAANWGALGDAGGASECEDYENQLEADPESWDPEMDYYCYG